MIPPDLAARLRMITEASFFNADQPLPGVQRTREIPASLPDLLPGQRIFATLQRVLPDGTFRALVAGQTLTLSLSQSASPGDTLELEVTQNTPRAVYAQVVGQESAAANSNASSQPVLSQTGRLISFLLTGQPTPEPAKLAANQPLLNAPPLTGAPLTPALRQALVQSGLFYESHQSQLLSGKMDLQTLSKEPQGQVASSPLRATPGAGGQAPAAASAGTEKSALERLASVFSQASQEEVAPVRTSPVPDRLLPVVHQQLDALATNQYVFHGQLWPGQPFEWIIDDPRDGQGDSSDEALQEWNTTLRVTLPRLGGLEAQLHLTPAGVAVRLRAAESGAIDALERNRQSLEDALAAVDVPLTGMVVEPGDGV